MNKNVDSQSELSNFIGIYIEALLKQGYKPLEIRKLIITSLLKEIENLSLDEGVRYNYSTLEPLFIFINNVLTNEIKSKQEHAYVPQIAEDISKTDAVIKYFSNKIKGLHKTC